MTGRPMHRMIEFPARLPDRHPDTLEMIARIEAVRLEEAPACCPTCGSTAPALRRCAGSCAELKPLSEFARNRVKPHGRDYYCYPCRRVILERWRRKQKRQQFREILGRTG